MRMQPKYYWILNLLILSLLASCGQQQKTNGVSSVPPKDAGSEPGQSTLDFLNNLVTSSPQPNTGNQPQQNVQVFPNALVTSSPQPNALNQPQQNTQGFLNALGNSNTEQPQKNSQNFPVFQTLFQSPGIQLSQPNPQQPQTQNQNFLNERILSAQTVLEAANIQTNPNSTLRLSLKDTFERANARNPQLLAAQRNLKISAAGITIAGATPNPQISLQYGFGSVYTKAGNPQQLGINQTVELAGKRSKRLSLAKSQYELAILQYNSTRFDIHGQVRRAYAELAAAIASDRSQEEQVQLLQRLVYIARKRFEAGAAPEAELLQAQLVLNQTEPQLRQAQGRIRQARIQLNALMGDSPAQNIEITDPGMFNVAVKQTALVPMTNAQIPTIQSLLAQGYEQRLDFKSAQQQIEVAQRQLRLARAQRTPDLQLSGGYLFTTEDAPNPNTNGVFFGATVNLPIFYRQQGEVAQAQATIEQSTEQQNVVRSQIAVDVRSAYEALLIAREKIRKYQSRLLPDSREVLALAEESYQVGKTNLASAIAVEQADQQNRSAYVDAVTAYQSAYADLEKAVGTPLSF